MPLTDLSIQMHDLTFVLLPLHSDSLSQGRGCPLLVAWGMTLTGRGT